MRSSKKTSSRDSSFWGMALSVLLHGVILVLVLFWGFRASQQPQAPQYIEGRIVSLSDSGGGEVGTPSASEERKEDQTPKQAEQGVKEEDVKKPEPEKDKPEPEPEKKELEEKVVKKEEPEKEKPKPEPKKEVKKEEPKKEPEKEKPKKEAVSLDEEKAEEKKKEVKKEEPEKKEVADKPEPPSQETEPEPKVEKEEKPDTGQKTRGIIEDIKRRKVLKDLKGGQTEEVARAETSEGSPGNRSSNNASGGNSGSSAVSPVIIGRYRDRIHSRISGNWEIPPSVPTDGSLEATIFFKIDGSGDVYDVRVYDSSGNPAFDNFCVRAIRKSAPLPPPPSEILEAARTDGITVPFTNRSF